MTIKKNKDNEKDTRWKHKGYFHLPVFGDEPRVCPNCGGLGSIGDDICDKCEGTGEIYN